MTQDEFDIAMANVMDKCAPIIPLLDEEWDEFQFNMKLYAEQEQLDTSVMEGRH